MNSTGLLWMDKPDIQKAARKLEAVDYKKSLLAKDVEEMKKVQIINEMREKLVKDDIAAVEVKARKI